VSFIQIVESWTEGLLRMAIGIGLSWIGAVEGAGYGLFLEVVGVIFIAAGIIEIWSVEAAAPGVPRENTMNGIHPALITCDIPVFYATGEGQTRRIAERLVALFREKGFTSRAIDVATSDADRVHWPRVQAAMVGASLHARKHQRSARRFCDRYAPELNAGLSAFFSVSLAAASDRADERDEALRIAREFTTALEWRPDEIVSLAGRLAFTQYGWLTRFIMTRIARRHGQPMDTSRDYEYTNWDEVARLADGVARRIAAEREHRAAA
jgi:menaquinone-dependent protoporphyrinogen oxidase